MFSLKLVGLIYNNTYFDTSKKFQFNCAFKFFIEVNSTTYILLNSLVIGANEVKILKKASIILL